MTETRTRTTPTMTTFQEWQNAYDYFNRFLYGGELPDCIMTLESQGKRVLGSCTRKQYVNQDGELVDGLTMNPKYFLGRSVLDVMATLVHEMCHIWEYNFGELGSRRTYHNKYWGDKMEALGLMPSSTGKPGGKRTGQQMHHYIVEGGNFEEACKQLLPTFQISWADRYILVEITDPLKLEELKKKGVDVPLGEDLKKERKKKEKTKYTCPVCGANVWGKPEMHLICGTDNVDFEAQE